jgi:three-Cys-motif partner protein
MRPPEFYKGKEQTWVKHFFLENYLRSLAFHIGYSFPRFIYVDGFSGPWRVRREALVDTSFHIALTQLNYVREALIPHGKHPKMRAVFVEEKPSRFASLDKAIEDYKGAIEAKPFLGTFEDNIENILASVKPGFTFFFIDPTGWTGFPLKAITPILRYTPGEVVINFMYDHINRFLNSHKPDTEASLDALFGTTEWRSLRAAKDREHSILNFYQEQVRAAGRFNFVTSTPIFKPTRDRAYYHLVYATRKPKGITEFRAVEKKALYQQEQVRHVAKRQDREQRSGQAEFSLELVELLGPKLKKRCQQQLARAENRILEALQRRMMDYSELAPKILELPLVWESDFKALLLKMREFGQIQIDGMGPRARAPKAGCRVRLINRLD